MNYQKHFTGNHINTYLSNIEKWAMLVQRDEYWLSFFFIKVAADFFDITINIFHHGTPMQVYNPGKAKILHLALWECHYVVLK